MFLKWTTEVRLDNSNDARIGYLGSFLFTFSDINEVIREACLNSRQKVYIVYFSRLTNHVLCENMWLPRNLLNICYCYLLKDMSKIVIFGFILRYVSVSCTCKSGWACLLELFILMQGHLSCSCIHTVSFCLQPWWDASTGTCLFDL